MKQLAIFLLALLFTFMGGCKKEHRYKIGVSQCSSDDWREKMNDEINREILLHDDALVEIRSGEDDSKKQIEDIDYFVENDFDIILVAPNETSSLTPKIKEVYEKGIPVVIFDRNINGDTYTSRIGVDNKGLGHSAAVYARHLVGEDSRALEIYGLEGSTPADDRHAGFSKEYKSHGGKIMATGYGFWKQELAERATDSLLRIYPDVNVIFAHNDRMAIGASKAAGRLGRKDIKIIGVDAAPEIGIQAVADGVIDATFLYPTEGHRLIQLAMKILQGEPYSKEYLLPASSAVDNTNADILLLQNESLKEETGKMLRLKDQIDEYWDRHNSQTLFLYASIAILVLLTLVLFLILRSYWIHQEYQQELLRQNKLLEDERDKQKELNSRLQEATKSKLVFFTNVSHDLRTPLTLISEPVAQLTKADNLTPSQEVLVKIADKNVRILQRLINQILDFRKYENGKLDLHLDEVDFRRIIKDWTDSFTQLASKRDIKLRLEAPEGEAPISLAIDVEKMERVFFNLVSNAFKYSRDNDSITISYTVEDNRLILRVADTGQGISTRDLGNIFDRFYQVDHIHPRGSGIGLSLVKAFVELHGGTISVESELNKGSEFIVSIPIVHVSEMVQAVEKKIESDAVEAELSNINADPCFEESKPLVLVIDDNSDIREMLGELLKTDYNVITAPNGGEGIRLAARYVPDLVICDVMMPGMDGLECCRRLKSETVTSHIPVILLTACSLDEQRAQGYESGADGYLSKPFSSEVLKSNIRSLIRNRKLVKELWRNPALNQIEETVAEKTGEYAGQESKSGSRHAGHSENDFYNRFLKVFYEQMSNSELTVDNLASMLGLQRTQLYRKIKAITNYSPVELMRNLRLRKARELLTSTDCSVSQIGYDVGFSTPAYFTKCYRDVYGESPRETRQNLS